MLAEKDPESIRNQFRHQFR